MLYTYNTKGVCPIKIEVEITENKITYLEFLGGGCPGNLKALQKIINGMSIDDVIETFKGITCGRKPTSCMDQLTKALENCKEMVGEK